MQLIQPVLSDDALQQDLAEAVPKGALRLWWLGQSGFVAKTTAATVVFDPYLSDSLTRKYADTDKPHVRMTARCLHPKELTGVDLITSSHNHTDHLDAETLLPLLEANPQAVLVIPEANRTFVAERLGCPPAQPLGMTDGQTRQAGSITIHAVPAAHEDVARDASGRCHYLGYVVEMGGWTIYHSGDTLRCDELTSALAPFQIDVALLPINGRRPERRVAGNLFGDEAARLAHDMGAGVAVPCHYDMFAFNTESPDLFRATCECLGQPYRILQCGERFELPRRS